MKAPQVRLLNQRCRVEPGTDRCPEHGPHNKDYCPGCQLRRVLRRALALANVTGRDIFTDAPEYAEGVREAEELGLLIGGQLAQLFPGLAPLTSTEDD
jgi:hypothetical protein